MDAIVLQYLFPGIKIGPGGDVELIDRKDGLGVQVLRWSYTQTQPSEATITANHDAAYAAAARAAIPAVTRDRLLVALHNAGLLDGINAYVAAATDPTIALRWNSATIIERTNPTVMAAAAAAGLTDTQVDAVFQAAALIV